MRRRRVRTALLAWATAICLAWAAAADAPEAVAATLTAGDAGVIVTDARGVIVGVGRVVAGASFELHLLEGFVGPARLTLLRPDGATATLEVVVAEGVLVAGFDLLVLLTDRVETFTVEVGGVAYHEAERREADASAGDGPGQGAGGPPALGEAPGETPGPPDEASGPPDERPAPDDPRGPGSPG
ncbi:MAG: hypothetical protein K0A98_15835, partial [Trueperaceae bacterium]|nr:hypothetical protein [Trueperaceae bacterium]